MSQMGRGAECRARPLRTPNRPPATRRRSASSAPPSRLAIPRICEPDRRHPCRRSGSTRSAIPISTRPGVPPSPATARLRGRCQKKGAELTGELDSIGPRPKRVSSSTPCRRWDASAVRGSRRCSPACTTPSAWTASRHRSTARSTTPWVNSPASTTAPARTGALCSMCFAGRVGPTKQRHVTPTLNVRVVIRRSYAR